MIRYRQVDKTFFPLYDRIPMRVQVTAQYKVEKLRRGLGGFVLVETPVKPYVKDFTAGEGERAEQWEKRFDLSHWAFFMAFDGEASRRRRCSGLPDRRVSDACRPGRPGRAVGYSGGGCLQKAGGWSKAVRHGGELVPGSRSGPDKD